MAFAVLSAMGAIYFFDVIRRTMRSFSRFHGNKPGHAENLRSADARRQLSSEKKRTGTLACPCKHKIIFEIIMWIFLLNYCSE